MYADKITQSMKLTIDETNRRREKQMRYNEEHGITPTAIARRTTSALKGNVPEEKAYIEPETTNIAADPVVKYMSVPAIEKSIAHARREMEKAAKELAFIEAAQWRDELIRLEDRLKEMQASKQ